jgi:DNA-binding beta-propeller fold protein YncE
LAFDGVDIWVANSGSDFVSKLRAANGTVLGSFAAGSFPSGVAFDGANIWVTNTNSNNVSKF